MQRSARIIVGQDALGFWAWMLRAPAGELLASDDDYASRGEAWAVAARVAKVLVPPRR